MRWRGLLGALGVVATLGATFGGASWLRQRSVARAFTDLRACLIGDPLAAGERVGDRLSAIEATLDLEPDGARANAWPNRCGKLALRLEEAADENRLPKLAQAARGIAEELKVERMGASELPVELGIEAVRLVLDAGRELDGHASPDPGVVPAPAPARALVTPNEIRRAVELFSGEVRVTSGGLDEQALEAIVLRGRSQSCVLRPGHPELTCGVYPELARGRSDAQGVETVVTREGSGFRVLRGPSLLVELPSAVKRADVMGQSVVALEAGQLTARRILSDNALIGPAEALADIGDQDYRPKSCRTERGTVLTASGWVAFESGGVFSKAVRAELPASAAPEGFTLSCFAGRASLGLARASLRGGRDHYEVHLARCAPSGCRSEHVELERLGGMNASGAPDQLAALLVLDFGTRVLLVWSSNGALRTRSAPLAELGRAPSRLLAAQLEGVMLESDMTRVDVLTRGERAVLSIPITAYGPKRPSSLVVLADASGHVRALLPP